jgi:hypothetical protein
MIPMRFRTQVEFLQDVGANIILSIIVIHLT